MTISASHREQLDKLMKTLDATSPHFVRCIIPNELKTGGILDAHLVMHQLNCNGVLEGIRICRKGYPSRLLFAEFLARYGILAASRVKAAKDPKSACFEVLDEIKMDTELYRIGLSKVLFKAGEFFFCEVPNYSFGLSVRLFVCLSVKVFFFFFYVFYIN
jgi:myosin heavy subunit